MSRCMTCGLDYERNGGPMICVCTECLNAPKAPDSYIEMKGIMRHNPAYDVWKEHEQERIRVKREGRI